MKGAGPVGVLHRSHVQTVGRARRLLTCRQGLSGLKQNQPRPGRVHFKPAPCNTFCDPGPIQGNGAVLAQEGCVRHAGVGVSADLFDATADDLQQLTCCVLRCLVRAMIDELHSRIAGLTGGREHLISEVALILPFEKNHFPQRCEVPRRQVSTFQPCDALRYDLDHA